MDHTHPLLDRISDYPRYHASGREIVEALVFHDRKITHAELAGSIDALAKALIACGVKKGDRVATLQTPCPEFIVTFLATASIGAIWVGLNPRHRERELLAVMRDARPKVLFARSLIGNRSYAAELSATLTLDEPPGSLVIFDADPLLPFAQSLSNYLAHGSTIDGSALRRARVACGGRDPCLLVYTSGSTGEPKGALLHHEGIVAFAHAQNEIWPLSPHRTLNFLPINHVGSVVDLSCPALVAGGKLVFQEQFDAAESVHLMHQHQITFWASVPSVFALQMTHLAQNPQALDAVQLIVWEGASMPDRQITELLHTGPPLATNYGLTESGGAGTILSPTRNLELLTDTVGAPFPGVQLRLVGPDGNRVSNGEAGEIQLNSRYNMLSYWNRPRESRAAFTDDGYLRTGDLAVTRPDGNIRIVGRLKQMFKSGGYNIYPREIETVLEAHPEVTSAVVVSRPDCVWQEVGIAFVIAKGLNCETLTTWCRERLANYKVPKRIVVLDSLPLLPIGKVDRAALEKQARDLLI